MVEATVLRPAKTLGTSTRNQTTYDSATMLVLICVGTIFVDCDSLMNQSLAVAVDFEPHSRPSHDTKQQYGVLTIPALVSRNKG